VVKGVARFGPGALAGLEEGGGGDRVEREIGREGDVPGVD
jgi:hypothetical protein